MGTKAWDFNAYFPAVASVSLEERKPQARWIGDRVAQGQLVIIGRSPEHAQKPQIWSPLSYCLGKQAAAYQD